MRTTVPAAMGATLLVAALASTAFGQAAGSLDRCQKAAAKETSKFAKAKAKAIASCLQKVSKELIKEGEGDATDAAKSCVSQMRKLVRSDVPAKTLDMKAEAKIRKFCDPTANAALLHTAADVLGPGATVSDPLNVVDLGPWCANFGGDGAIDNVQEWVDCQLAAAGCQAEQQVSVEYPLVLLWIDEARTAIQALPPDTKTTDAVDALDALELALDSDSDAAVDLRCGPMGTSDTILLASGQTTPVCLEPLCVGDDDGELELGVGQAYADNNDGTVTDVNTFLMWEKKCDDGGLHDWDTQYNWEGAFGFISMLNDRCADGTTDCTVGGDPACTGIGNGECGFAGHRDWRLPNNRELHSLVDAEREQPAINGIFDTPHLTCSPGCTTATCSCTFSDRYWTSTTYRPSTSRAWDIDFGFGQMRDSSKASGMLRVRGVRNAS